MNNMLPSPPVQQQVLANQLAPGMGMGFTITITDIYYDRTSE